MDKIKISSLYNHPAGVALEFPEPTKTQQHFADEVNINKIVARANKTGFLGDPLKPGTRKPMYGDFSKIGSYHEAETAVLEARDRFQALPAVIRDRFNNDPSELFSFMGDAKNLEEARKLGLLPLAVANKPIISEKGDKSGSDNSEPVEPPKAPKKGA